MTMRMSLGGFALLTLLLLMPGAPAAAAPALPTCAEGPTTVAGTTYGTPCDDTIVVPPGVAAVQGGPGNDTIVPAPVAAASAPCPSGCFLGVGSQVYDGGPGDDVVYGQRGNDTLRGGEGNDQLFGGIGDDVLQGGPGNDRLAGGFGADAIDGEAGDDYVRGDGTIDRIRDSGGGTDTLSYATGITPGFGAGIDTGQPGFPPSAEGRGVYLDLGAGGLNGNNGVAPFGGGVDEVAGQDFENVIGTPFSDYIVGGTAGQVLRGGGGADVLLGSGPIEGGPDGDNGDAGGVKPPDPGKVSVGLMTASGGSPYTQLYLTGSAAGDAVTVTYAGSEVGFALAAGPGFDQSAAAAAGCTATATQASCPLSAPLDSIVLAGIGGDDVISATGFPSSTAVILLGGEGGDSLTGGDASEDVLVDGPAAAGGGGDALDAGAGDDALLHNAGPDQLLGWAGSDLFLSNSICDGAVFVGGADRDNVSWARFGEGVGANLGSGLAGHPGSGDTPICGGAPFDSLREVEDLEGGNSADVFYGDAGPNQLLGHTGPDVYRAGAGGDTILANSGDADPVIDCGADLDRALVDYAEYGDAAPIECEAVREADPNSFQLLPDFPLPPPPPPPPVVPKPDRTPPRTRVLFHPRAVVSTRGTRRTVVFRFASSERGSSFRCKLDAKPQRTCRSPRSYSLPLGPHVVRIRAVDAAGNADRTPAVLRVRVRHR